MKNIFSLSAVTVAALFSNGSSAQEVASTLPKTSDYTVIEDTFDRAPMPQWLVDGAIYHIYPSSFQDSDGDGIGDLKGIESRLDYVKSLGVNAIWMSPIFCSEFEDGGYDITDFYKVDPRFGTNDDLVDLVKAAHSMGLKVCLDLVAGHTSNKHPWFLQSAGKELNQRYSDYFIWGGEDARSKESKFVKSTGEREGYYKKNFFDIQPALNYGYFRPDPAKPWQQSMDAPGPQAVRREIKNIISFWMDKGVDGFRCDMAPSLVKNDDANRTGNKALWNDMRSWFQAKYPEGVLISEWSEPQNAVSAGFHVDLIIHNKTGNKIYRPMVCATTDKGEPTDCFFAPAGKGQVKDFVEHYTEELGKTHGKGMASMPTCSHDIWRLNRLDRNTPEQLKVALTFFLTLPPTPVIYYGEEIGMRNIEDAPYKEGSKSSRNRSSCRTPMQWDASANAGFSTAASENIYLPIDPNPTRPTVEAEEGDPHSVLNYVKGLLDLRKNIPALGYDGGWEYLSSIENPYPMVYLRSIGDEKYIVAMNPRATKAEVTLDGINGIDEYVYGTGTKCLKARALKNGGVKLTLDKFTAVICRVR